ncbi:uncharacterized protein LY89DRAFT_690392 [Mollisia scopiformis]|uniref:Uncharacterized protein n=1 Tax=Mollisia scopiformis TaxID=149040 RepID=A0A132BCG5_MOLSC|nr:uncharacterized protein LY89DRAFT_690392 [Mollisia scopiformis]KUJ09347.1 hypothetical protein LY89DRAFT_690392 [Mollisia scopiformis]
MFGSKRRRAASNPPLNGTNASASATTAAAQAFLKNRSSNASLSSAAAAAALRSRPTTPTSVADVQTKRTLRRAGSTSSVGSSVSGSIKGPPGSQLERRGSVGSMTERTFREPSPARSQPVPSAPDAPPVPAIPKNMQQPQPPTIPAKSHRRAASLEAPPMRVASPPPNKASGRGSSLGPTGSTQPPRRSGPRASGLSSVQELTRVDRPASRGSVHSINFSMPTSSRPTSPMGQRRLTSPAPQRQNLPKIVSPTNQNLIYDPNTRSFLPEVEILAIEQRLNNAATRPVKKKKKPVSAAGSHLSSGGMGAKPRGTAIDALEAAESSSARQPVQQPVPTPAPVSAPAPVIETAPPPPPTQYIPAPASESPKSAPPRRRKKKVVLSDSEDDQGSYNPGSSDTDSDVPQTFNTRAGTLLAKKPSIVREDREREEEEDDTPGRTKASGGLTKLDTSPAAARQISPSPLPRSVAGRGHGRGQARASAAFAQERQQGRSVSQPPLSPTEPPVEGVGLVSKDSVRGGRVHSVSPARTAHFAVTPESLVVKHQPPARSISPRKSALKHSNSPRGPSPVEGQSSEVNGSEASSSVVGSEELTVPKKKANRVSFDETNVVVGQAAAPVTTDSPVVLSPQTKRSWFSMGRGKKKEPVMTDEDDEVMKPRPALPSFGSVRERKPSKEVEERQLVKPAEPIEKLPPASPPLFTSPTGEIIENPLGQSNDHVVGAILAQDATSRNEANISKSREPLPPEVTSVEGSGYHSDTDSSVYSMENHKSDVGMGRADSVKRGPEDGHVDTYRALTNHEDSHIDEHANGKTVTEEPEEEEAPTPKAIDIVPEIAILQATPTIDESISKNEWPDMPGSWGSSTSDSGSATQEDSEVVEPAVVQPTPAIQPTPADVGVAEPSPVTHAPIPPQDPEIVSASTHVAPAILEEPEESDASVYSDAAEELTDTEGDGYLSLNAVVESPVVNTNLPGLAISTPPDSPITKLTKEKAFKKSQLPKQDSGPEIDAGWDQVQAYWSTLSAEKKKQLELEAREEAEDSESTIEAKPAPKPKKKKKVAVQPEPAIVASQREPAVAQERNYMIQPGAKAGPNGFVAMRSSMRAEPASTTKEPHIRKSMRGSEAMRGSLRGSSESAEPKGSLQKKYRPMSYPPPETKPDPVAVNRHVRALSAASAAAAPAAAQRDLTPAKPTLRRKGSGDSDSSFKRAKPSNNNEIPSFRRSMRGSMDQDQGRQSSPNRSSRFSLRSLSPTGSAFRRPFNSGAPAANSTPTHMRNSLRNSTRDAPTLRNPSKGFGRGSSAKPSKQKSRPSKSRFADSSDEDEDRPTFRSRFNDSSDEDEPGPMPLPRTMRSIAPPVAKRTQDGDSSDLPDSDEEKSGLSSLRLAKKRGTNGTTAPVSNQGATLASGSLRRSGSGRETISSPITTVTPSRPNHSRRGSFMSILRRKKPDPASKVRKSDAESPARRDTPLERSKSDLQQLRAERPSSPKLQKRRTISRENSSSWPLAAPAPPRILGGEDGRPFSADNGMGVTGGAGEKDVLSNGNGERPDLGTRRFTATGLADVDIAGVTDIPGRKKKKFGKLRRMFRLDD